MLHDFFESAHIMTETHSVDAYGANQSTYAQGRKISVGFTRKSSTEIRAADKDAVKETWCILTDINVTLAQNDVVKRDATGTLFRVTGINADRQTPRTAEVHFRIVDAEVIA